MTDRTTRRDYARPYRPWPLRVGNPLLGLLPGGSLAPERLIEVARKAEDLYDLGEPDVLEPLTRLVDAIEAEAHLHPIGRMATRTRLVGALRNRLRAQALFAAHPEILRQPITAPIVITGLQRTGTTLLHRLLAADPRLRSLQSWEALNPAPFPDAPNGEADPRRAFARRAEKALSWMAPDFFAVHPVDAEGQEEEVLLLDFSFLSTVPEATLRVPSYARWLEDQDQTPSYDTLKRMLQLLQWQRPAARWVLKTPHHLEWLDTLLTVFPDATVIHTHRDPAATVPSFCSMVAHGRGVMSDAVDPLDIADHWCRKLDRMLSRALATRARRGDEGFVDVHYDRFIADPMGTVASLYPALGLEWTPQVEQAIKARLHDSPRNRYGRHAYEPADFGLSPDGLRTRYRAYIERFGL